MTNCGRKYHIFPGCKFEPRYDVSAVQNTPEIKGHLSAGEAVEILEKYRNKTYVADVCIRCGKAVNRHSGEMVE